MSQCEKQNDCCKPRLSSQVRAAAQHAVHSAASFRSPFTPPWSGCRGAAVRDAVALAGLQSDSAAAGTRGCRSLVGFGRHARSVAAANISFDCTTRLHDAPSRDACCACCTALGAASVLSVRPFAATSSAIQASETARGTPQLS